jgi:hypothetical protein
LKKLISGLAGSYTLSRSPKPGSRPYKPTIDFGPELGTKRSSAQLTTLYRVADLEGRLVLGVDWRAFDNSRSAVNQSWSAGVAG